MSFAAPFVLGIAAAAALVLAGLHLLSVRRPPVLLLPTARFLPANEVRAVSRTRTPSDLLLLLLRVAVLLAAGFALAGPRFHSPRDRRVAVVAIEPGVVADTAAVRRLLATDALVADARLVVVAESLSAPTATMYASYDAAQLFPRAIHVAARLVQEDPSIDSLALIVLRAKPPTEDRAWWAWRAAWPGRVVTYSPRVDAVATVTRRVVRRVVVVPRAGDAGSANGMPDDDIVEASFRWHAARVNHAEGVVSDSALVDSIFFSRDASPSVASRTALRPGQVRITWPLNGAPRTGAANVATEGRWSGWRAAPVGDTATALVAGGMAILGTWSVAQFGSWKPAANAATPANMDTANIAGRVQPLAWWSDGRVAAIEEYVAQGCERTVAVVAAQGQDILLSPSANAFFDRLLAPCRQPSSVAIAALNVRTVLGGALAPASALHARRRDDAGDATAANTWVRWIPSLLLAISLAALLLEWRARRAVGEVLT